MNRNGQIDWSEADRVVSNDTRYVTYNGENRPVRWTHVSPDSSTPNSPTPNSSTPNSSTPPLISMSYDHMGRRRAKNAQRFFYDGYLQVANYEHSATNSQLTTHNSQLFTWDPTEPIATRPLCWFAAASLASVWSVV